LLDENISPALVRLLAGLGVHSQSVPHVGLAGRTDHVVWKYAFDHDFAVVTTNARDFIDLLDASLHPGLIVFRESGLSRQEQWERFIPVVGSTSTNPAMKTSC
jgi:predicted nuclease of predicted toxin-antitoxin system